MGVDTVYILAGERQILSDILVDLRDGKSALGTFGSPNVDIEQVAEKIFDERMTLDLRGSRTVYTFIQIQDGRLLIHTGTRFLYGGNHAVEEYLDRWDYEIIGDCDEAAGSDYGETFVL